MAEARIPDSRGNIVVIDTDAVFRAFKDGESCDDIALSYRVRQDEIETLIRDECKRRDEGSE